MAPGAARHSGVASLNSLLENAKEEGGPLPPPSPPSAIRDIFIMSEQNGRISLEERKSFKEEFFERFKQILLQHDYEQLFDLGYRLTTALVWRGKQHPI